MRRIGEHAAVIGGSIAGQLVARSLTEAYERVTPVLPVRGLRSGLLADRGRSLAHGVDEHSHPARPPALPDGACASDRRRHGRALSRRSLAPLREPRLRGEHSGDGRRVGRRRGVRPLVQQRAPRQRAEVPASPPPRSRTRATTVAGFVGARADDAVVFVRNTTEAINVLSAALPAGARVLSSPVEHHSNMLPWRRHDLRLLPFTGSPDELLDACERALRSARPRIDLVAVTGASNVTGEVWPVAELAELAHAHGAQLFVDAAQLAPHRAIDMAGAGIDFLALSGHKLYAPFGAGALVGDGRRLRERRAAAARRRSDRARHAGRRHLGGRAPAPRGRLAERRRSRRARRGLPRPARPRDGDRRRTRTGARGVPLERVDRRPGTATGSRSGPTPSTASASPRSTSTATAIRCWPPS